MMENRNIIQTALISALLVSLLGAIPFADVCCCLFYLAGGALSLILYNRYYMQSQEELSIALCIYLGITTGLMAAFLSLFFEWFIYLSFGYWEFELAKQMAEHMDEMPAFLEEMLAEFEKQQTHGFIWAGPLLTNLIVMPLFCIGGALITRVFLNNQKAKQERIDKNE
jgi:hypothetical protein